jgi:hypothetical protein
VRASQATLFAEYRATGGTAARIEDVTALPDPCVQNLPGPPTRSSSPASITSEKSLVLPSQ